MTKKESLISAIERARSQSESAGLDSILVPFKETDLILAFLKSDGHIPVVKLSDDHPYPCTTCCSPSEQAACCGCEKEKQWQEEYGKHDTER